MLTTSKAVDLYLADLTRLGYSDRTLSTYRRILDRLDRHLPAEEDISKVTTDDLRRFLNQCREIARAALHGDDLGEDGYAHGSVA